VTPRGEWTYAYTFGKTFRSGRGTMTAPQDDTVNASFKDFANGVLEQEGVCLFKKQEPVPLRSLKRLSRNFAASAGTFCSALFVVSDEIFRKLLKSDRAFHHLVFWRFE
jgi:hypothetical protein